MGSRRRHLGITMVELVIVIAILGILMALLLPAVQFARESARRMTCSNQLRQIAVAMHEHEGAHRHLPTGGWGWRWTGEPDRGFSEAQPGGWIYNVLPYLEQESIRVIGLGQPHPYRAQLLAEAAQTPVQDFVCPTRRGATALPFVHAVDYVNMTRPPRVTRSDYAACSGDAAPDPSRGRGRGPPSLQAGDSPFFVWVETDRTGVVFRRSRVTFGEITDGLTNTYLAGEKYVARSAYATGKAENDDQHIFVGYDSDTLRTTDPEHPLLFDGADFTSDHAFGSAHASGCHMAMADASVHFVSYQIDWRVHQTLGSKSGGEGGSLPP